MNLKIKTGTVGYNNKILVSDEKCSLGKNETVNTEGFSSTNAPAMKSHAQTTNSNDMITQKPTITHKKKQEPQAITHNKEKIALVLFLASGFAIWNMF